MDEKKNIYQVYKNPSANFELSMTFNIQEIAWPFSAILPNFPGIVFVHIRINRDPPVEPEDMF